MITDELLTTYLPVLVIGLIGLVFGALIGALLASAVSGGEKPPAKNLALAMRIWRDKKNNRLSIEHNGRTFISLEKMNPRQIQEIKAIVQDLQSLLGTVDPLSRINPPLKGAASAPHVETQSTIPTGTPSTPRIAALPNNESTVFIQPPSLDLGDILSQAIVPEPKLKEKSEEAPKSIAAQIDGILQERILTSPLKERAIRLMEIPERGLVVLVDGKAYDGVGEVPDLEVRQFIQSCVSIWENQR